MVSQENHTEYIQIPKTEYEALQTQLSRYRMEQVLLQQELANLKRMLFGSKSERHIGEDPSQLALNLGFEQTPSTEPQKKRSPIPGKNRSIRDMPVSRFRRTCPGKNRL